MKLHLDKALLGRNLLPVFEGDLEGRNREKTAHGEDDRLEHKWIRLFVYYYIIKSKIQGLIQMFY